MEINNTYPPLFSYTHAPPPPIYSPCFRWFWVDKTAPLHNLELFLICLSCPCFRGFWGWFLPFSPKSPPPKEQKTPINCPLWVFSLFPLGVFWCFWLSLANKNPWGLSWGFYPWGVGCFLLFLIAFYLILPLFSKFRGL